MKGINLAEQCHIVNATAPIDINGAGATSDLFSMENYAHASIICALGVTGAATTITVTENTSSTAGGATVIDSFTVYSETTAAGDTLSTTTTTGSTDGFAASTNDGVFYVLELDASALSDGYEWVGVQASDPSNATLYACTVVLSGARYQELTTPTAIA